MSQEQIKKPAPQESEETTPACPKQADKTKLKEETDELVDAIDAVLEEDCEKFVKEYVQRGGE